MAERLKFALFGNIYQAKKSASVKQLISLLAAHDAELYIDTDFYTYLSQELHFDVCPTGLISDSDFQADIAVSMGGDGTFLAAASRVGNKDIPILGINMGRLGFLADVSPEEIKEMLSCLGAVTRSYGKGEIIYHAGECVHSMGLVLSGNVQIESDDVWGNHSVLDDITPGFFFAETYASLSKEPLMVNVVSAAAKTEVLFLNIGRLLTTCTNSCTHHNRLIHNLFFISARKNLLLSRRIFHTTPK